MKKWGKVGDRRRRGELKIEEWMLGVKMSVDERKGGKQFNSYHKSTRNSGENWEGRRQQSHTIHRDLILFVFV